jgi:hypothetical protein
MYAQNRHRLVIWHWFDSVSWHWNFPLHHRFSENNTEAWESLLWSKGPAISKLRVYEHLPPTLVHAFLPWFTLMNVQLWLAVFGRQHNNKNKPIELLTLVLFDGCYMFGPHFGPSSDSLIKYVSCYWTVQIWIHISSTHHRQPTRSFKNFLI